MTRPRPATAGANPPSSAPRIALPIRRASRFVFSFLLHPRVRRARRWVGFVTVPGSLLVLYLLGLERGLALVAVEAAALAALGLLWLALDPEQREAALDLVLPPVERRLLRAEGRVLRTYVDVFRRRPGGWTYHRGSPELAPGLAFIPVAFAELALVHLLVPWFWVRVAMLALSVYALVWLLGWTLSFRVYRHRLGDGELELRLGALYRVRVPLPEIASVERRRERVARGYRVLVRGDKAFLIADGRVDVHVELTEPVELWRPLAGPTLVRALAVAADEPDALVRAIPTLPVRPPADGPRARAGTS